jgi:glycosyltransferase involved in cell wall biosynthesis
MGQRVLGAVNYSLTGIDRDCRGGHMPRHHMWGLDALREAGMQVQVLGSPGGRQWQRVTGATSLQLGDLDRQRTLLRAAREHEPDVIVCAEMGFARGLGQLRRRGLLRTPLVGVMHPYAPRTRWTQSCAAGFDHVICLTRRAFEQMREVMPDERLSQAGMGPDLDWPGYRGEDGGAVVSTGRTHRDLGLLAEASARVGAPLVLHDTVPETPSPDRTEKIGAPYSEVMDDLRAASVIAIPLTRTDGCFGITELNDALALGKPVVMTRNPHIDVDIEAVGCGRWVAPGDLDGWVERLTELQSNPGLRQQMGASGRSWAEENWNHRRFGTALVDAVTAVTAQAS